MYRGWPAAWTFLTWNTEDLTLRVCGVLPKHQLYSVSLSIPSTHTYPYNKHVHKYTHVSLDMNQGTHLLPSWEHRGNGHVTSTN